MTTNKKIIFIILGILLLCLAIVLFMLNTYSKNNVISKLNYPGATPKEIKNNRVIFQTKDGPVSIKNIFNKPGYDPEKEPSLVIAQSSTEKIIYVAEGDYFDIKVLSKPNFQASRSKAESDFLKALDIVTVDACRLKPSLFAVTDLNDDSLRQETLDLGLSFCENSLDKPKN